MATWRDLANDDYGAAGELFRKKRWRSCVSRAYYAAYAAVTDALVRGNITMPAARANPTHAALPNMIENNLTRVASRWKLSSIVRKLYRLRIMADYDPRRDVERSEARIAMGLMTDAFQSLRGVR